MPAGTADRSGTKIDPATGKATPMTPAEAAKVPGMPDPDVLCDIEAVESETYDKPLKDDDKKDKEYIFGPAYRFDCTSSPKCEERHKEAGEKRKKVQKDIDALKVTTERIKHDISTIDNALDTAIKAKNSATIYLTHHGARGSVWA